MANVPLWSFYYHRGPAHVQGIVEAKDEATAFLVAVRWCTINGHRPPAAVFPMILATEEILKQRAPGPEEVLLVDEVAATTGVMSQKTK